VSRRVHLGVQVDRSGDDHEIEVARAGGEHRLVVGKHAHAAGGKGEGLALLDKRVRTRVTGRDELGVAALFETGDGGVVRTGEAAETDDGDADRRLHTISSAGSPS